MGLHVLGCLFDFYQFIYIYIVTDQELCGPRPLISLIVYVDVEHHIYLLSCVKVEVAVLSLKVRTILLGT